MSLDIDLDDGPIDPAMYGVDVPDEEAPPSDAPNMSREEAVAQLMAAGQPSPPEVRKPGTGTTTLLVGLEVDGEVYKDVVVRELRGIDQEAISKLSQDKGIELYFLQVEDLVLRRCVESIGPVKPTPDQLAGLLTGDRAQLFGGVLMTTFGDTKDYEGVRCPHCQAESDIQIDIPGMLDVRQMQTETPYSEVAMRDGSTIRVRYPTGKDQMQVMQEKRNATPEEQNTLMLRRCIVNDNIPDRAQYALSLGAQDRRKLVRAMLDKCPAINFKEVSVPCPTCQEDIPFAFGWADLLFG